MSDQVLECLPEIAWAVTAGPSVIKAIVIPRNDIQINIEEEKINQVKFGDPVDFVEVEKACSEDSAEVSD